RLARAMPGSDFAQARFAQLRFIDGLMRWEDPVSGATRASIALSDLLSATGHERVEVRYLMLPKLLKQKRYTRATHSAVFCEVRVDEAFGTVRVTRVVSAVAAGRIMNLQLARSQIMGGVVWGISQALHEETLSDHRLGRFM